MACVAAGLLGRAWTAVAFDPDGASGLGVPGRRADLALLVTVGIAAVAALPAVGALLVTSLFVVPAAVARLVTDSVPRLVVASVAIAAAQGLVGLYGALWLDVPPGPAIAVLGAAAYALVATLTSLAPSPEAATA
jgi:ABC-type Mn2+/Zn2+ transport system permease subunit